MESHETSEIDILNNLVSMYRNQITDSYLFMSDSLRLLNQYERSTSNMINLLMNQRQNQNPEVHTNNTETQRLRDESRNLINYLRNTRPRVRTNVNVVRSRRNNSTDDTSQLFNTIDNLIQTLTTDINDLTPVIVAPSEDQINRATELIHYGNIENPLNNRCPITLVDFSENDRIRQIIPCGHCFNNRALLRWFTTNCRCPVCRTDIRDYNPLNAIRNPYSNSQQSSTTEQSEP